MPLTASLKLGFGHAVLDEARQFLAHRGLELRRVLRRGDRLDAEAAGIVLAIRAWNPR